MQKLYIRKIRDNKLDKLKQWASIISFDRKAEAIASILAENVEREFAFIAQIEGSHYFIGYMESSGNIIPADMNLPINKDHVAVLKECLEMPVIGEKIYDISAI